MTLRLNLTGLHNRNRLRICWNTSFGQARQTFFFFSINIESRCHQRSVRKLCAGPLLPTCERSDAEESGGCGPGSRGHGCGMLSLGPESGTALPKALRDPVRRPRPSARDPEEEATRGAEGMRRTMGRRRRNWGKEGKQMCPTTLSGRKQSSVGSVSAQETSRRKVREQRREVFFTGGGSVEKKQEGEKKIDGNGRGKSDGGSSGWCSKATREKKKKIEGG